MELVIVTGLSGAGKSKAVDALEDMGFYCVDNMPPPLISKFAALCVQPNSGISRVAVVTDMRSREMFGGLAAELELLTESDIPYKLLFLDTSDDILRHRYKETRRKHPLLTDESGSVNDAIQKERRLLEPARAAADYTIDTTTLLPNELKERIGDIFLDKIATGMLISCVSFGFKYGIHTEADLMFDVRCLPNPFYIAELKSKTGEDREVRDYVFGSAAGKELEKRITDLVEFLIPQYQNEGKSQLTIAYGCTGGKHRSVAFAQELFDNLSRKHKRIAIRHRDITKH
ncbi:MAG: RNase adapter RapZ [Oscillospiraceae bacterium]|nr:RNase adapter RapZ [Oscillospiraceae bacterium]